MDSDPREGFIEIRGYRIHYLIWGTKGLGVVLIHSMGMDAHGFDLLSEDLQHQYRVLALDILDHGDSDTPVNSISINEHAHIIFW
jgi:pimeloyl-ACP methyl ester carboxylesterase